MRTVNRRSTYLTTDRKTYEKVRDLAVGEMMHINFVNDIVSSARGSVDTHHTLRRHELVRRMIHGGFNKIMVRYVAGMAVNCTLVGSLIGAADACMVRVKIMRAA